MKVKWPPTILEKARNEAYEYFDKNVRPLPKNLEGEIDPNARGLVDNDIDAFRHAYVSGVFAAEYSEETADIFGRINEIIPDALYSDQKNNASLNMDLWNNAIGRKYGLEAKSRRELLKLIHKAMDDGELILTPEDTRKYEGATGNPVNKSKPVIVLQQSETGRNEVFYDLVKKETFSAEEFIAKIQEGDYPGYSVKTIKGQPTPVSKPDKRSTNNLG